MARSFFHIWTTTAVRRVETAYDKQGNAYLLTNYDATTSGNIVNQVQRSFNGLGQMTTEWQSHSGAVNTGSSPKVQYAYSEMPSGANHSRLTSMTYPNGRVITSNYTSGLDADISRLSELKDGSTVLEGYSYLGRGTVVKRAHPQSGVDLSYVKLSGESVGDAGDQYTGLDRFGRITDQRWITAANGVAVDRYQYTYDCNGNRTAESNSLNSNLNETYGYDSLNQLTNFSTTGTTKSWDFDALGNWDGVTTNSTTQTRTHNRQNEITAVSGATTPTFDANGNMTKDETAKQYVYDAWNRMVVVKNAGGSELTRYEYDALTRRIQESASGRDLYYSDQWQVIQENVGNDVTTYLWSPVYVDAMVARDFDSDSNGSLEQRLYQTHDANFNVTALVNMSGTVVERYTYDPFGSATVRDGSWTVASPAYSWQYLHQGGRLNAESGLYSFRYREYSSTLGRWVTMDPIGYQSNSRNLYNYISNNSSNSFDPLGLKALDGNAGDPTIEREASFSFNFADDIDGPNFSINVKTWAELLFYIRDYLKDNPCYKCIRTLKVGGHGSSGSFLRSSDAYTPAVDIDITDILQFEKFGRGNGDKPHKGETSLNNLNRLKEISKFMCKDGKIHFVSCSTFSGIGSKLYERLEGIFGKGNVVGYDNGVIWNFNGSVSVPGSGPFAGTLLDGTIIHSLTQPDATPYIPKK